VGSLGPTSLGDFSQVVWDYVVIFEHVPLLGLVDTFPVHVRLIGSTSLRGTLFDSYPLMSGVGFGDDVLHDLGGSAADGT